MSMRFDFTPALVIIATAFVVVESVQFLHALPGGERGLLLFEKTCPLPQRRALFGTIASERAPGSIRQSYDNSRGH